MAERSSFYAALRAPLRRLLFLLALVLLGSVATAHAQERRIALVIGNGKYDSINPLPNAVNDARLIRDTLEGMNFEVVYRENTTKADLERAISVFTDKIYAAGSSGVALVYYAGHGLQSNGENFLLPTDINAQREADLRFDAVRASDVLAQMESAQSAVKIVILDACRDNPFATKFGGGRNRGLAEIGLGNSEFFVAYAATSGNLADDNYGDSGHSPYAASLAKRLATPNSEINNTFRLIRIDVSSATREKQLPEARTTMRREFYFVGGAPAPRTDVAAISPIPQAGPVVPKTTDILGRWCESGRGAGISLMVTPTWLNYGLGRDGANYKVVAIRELSGSKIQVEWQNRGRNIIFEFGDFDAKSQRMTQLRGRQAGDADWKDYNLRFRKCEE